MSVYWSSKGGEMCRAAARRIAPACLLILTILTKGHAQPAADPALVEAVRAFETALRQKNFERALAAWDFQTPARRNEEEATLRSVFSAQAVGLASDAPSVSTDGQTAATLGTFTQISEPRGEVEQWSLLWKKTPAGWRITARETFGGIDGLVHLELQKTGFVANGQTIELEDLVLKMIDGTFFLNTQEAGPTALVFVGKGHVTFKPRPVTERGQMKIFAKSEILDDEVSRVFLRLHPADLYRTLKPGSFVDDPKSPARLGRASDFFDQHKNDAFILDAPVAGAPWWLLPNLSDAAIAFDTRRFGVLTLSLSSFDSEGVSLFNRRTQKQITVYPRANATPPSDEDTRALDVVSHDLSMTVNPSTFDLTGRDVIGINVRSGLTSFRFRLDDDLHVRSVSSVEGGRHLFFRIRGQNSILVSMGFLAGRVGRMNLIVEYAGRLPAGTVESEILQTTTNQLADDETPTFFIDPALIYSKRRPFYPEIGDEDYATSTLNVTVPADWTVVSGGARSERTEASNRVVTHVQKQDAKYIAFVVARLLPIANERSGALAFDAFGQSRSRREAFRSVGWLKSGAQFFEHLFGPLPYSPLTMALVEAQVPGGHSPPGLVIVQNRPPLMGGGLKDDPATFNDIPGFFLAHELAHQWWGHGVTPRSYRDRWVSEGFAQYAAALWSRQSFGEDTFNRVLRKMANWSKRMTALGPVDLGNRVGHIQNNAQAHRAVVYDKGALVLDMVRRTIGDEPFRQALLRLQRDHRFKEIDSETVRSAFETEGKVDLDGLWEIFVRNTTLPTVRVEKTATGPEIVVDGYTGPLPIVARVGTERMDLVVTGRLKVPGVGADRSVVLDPDGIGLVTVVR